jgi:hypothetical protein
MLDVKKWKKFPGSLYAKQKFDPHELRGVRGVGDVEFTWGWPDRWGLGVEIRYPVVVCELLCARSNNFRAHQKYWPDGS